MYKECFPSKSRVITTENKPFFTDFLCRLKRKKSREFSKNRMSNKYLKLQKKYNVELKKAKHSFYAKKVKLLKSSNSRQWWTQIKKLVKLDNKDEKVEVDEIKHLPDEDQVNIIAQHFAAFL